MLPMARSAGPVHLDGLNDGLGELVREVQHRLGVLQLLVAPLVGREAQRDAALPFRLNGRCLASLGRR